MLRILDLTFVPVCAIIGLIKHMAYTQVQTMDEAILDYHRKMREDQARQNVLPPLKQFPKRGMIAGMWDQISDGMIVKTNVVGNVGTGFEHEGVVSEKNGSSFKVGMGFGGIRVFKNAAESAYNLPTITILGWEEKRVTMSDLEHEINNARLAALNRSWDEAETYHSEKGTLNEIKGQLRPGDECAFWGASGVEFLKYIGPMVDGSAVVFCTPRGDQNVLAFLGFGKCQIQRLRAGDTKLAPWDPIPAQEALNWSGTKKNVIQKNPSCGISGVVDGSLHDAWQNLLKGKTYRIRSAKSNWEDTIGKYIGWTSSLREQTTKHGDTVREYETHCIFEVEGEQRTWPAKSKEIFIDEKILSSSNVKNTMGGTTNSTVNSVLGFFRNLALSQGDKLLLKYGLENPTGEVTADGLSLMFEAQWKSFRDEAIKICEKMEEEKKEKE